MNPYGLTSDRIVEFIKRRFPNEDRWLTGNCFYLSLILKYTFGGKIMYDPIEGHFIYAIIDVNPRMYFDWTGQRFYTEEQQSRFYDWDTLQIEDQSLKNRLIRDCIL